MAELRAPSAPAASSDDPRALAVRLEAWRPTSTACARRSWQPTSACCGASTPRSARSPSTTRSNRCSARPARDQLAYPRLVPRSTSSSPRATSAARNRAPSRARPGELLRRRAGAALRPLPGRGESLRYDIDLLAQRFGVSFETVCHRLSTLQRPDARGVPFFFVRVDRRATSPSASRPPTSTSRTRAAPARCGTSTRPSRSRTRC